MPSKRLIVLDNVGPAEFRVVLWADVPAARQAKYANPTAVSAWEGASASELDDVRAGRVVEQVETISVPPGASFAQIQAVLEDRWVAFNAEVQGETRWACYGTYWDGATWVAGGVP